MPFYTSSRWVILGLNLSTAPLFSHGKWQKYQLLRTLSFHCLLSAGHFLEFSRKLLELFFFGKHMCVFVSLFLASPFSKKLNASVTFFGYFPSPALLGPKDLEDSARIQGDWMLELGKKLLFPTHFTVSHEFTFPHLYLSFPRFSNKVSLCFSSPPSTSHCTTESWNTAFAIGAEMLEMLQSRVEINWYRLELCGREAHIF